MEHHFGCRPAFHASFAVFCYPRSNKNSAVAAHWGAAWVAVYLTLGAIQEQRAAAAGASLAESRGHVNATVSAKPSFGNLLLWKTVYEHEGRFWVDAVRAGRAISIIEGESVVRLDIQIHYPWLDSSSQQARDIERFRWFSNNHLAVDKEDPFLIVDVRYSHLPNEIKGLWGIRLDPTANPEQHVEWTTRRSADSARFEQLWSMLTSG